MYPISDTPGSSKLKIHVYAKRSLKDDKFIGGTEDTIESLIAKGATTGQRHPVLLISTLADFSSISGYQRPLHISKPCFSFIEYIA